METLDGWASLQFLVNTLFFAHLSSPGVNLDAGMQSSEGLTSDNVCNLQDKAGVPVQLESLTADDHENI